jgi:hypothetical protein
LPGQQLTHRRAKTEKRCIESRLAFLPCENSSFRKPCRPTVMENSLSEETAANQARGVRVNSGSFAVNGGLQHPPPTGSGEPRDSALVQPWRCFWPPAFGSDTCKKLEGEHPDVLTWRFDITRPFDRPWRLWTGPSPLEGGGCSSGRKGPLASSECPKQHEPRATAHCPPARLRP